MTERNRVNQLEFPEAKSIVVSGDIHGEFTKLVYKCCEQYGMRDTLMIVAGDCGFGFEQGCSLLIFNLTYSQLVWLQAVHTM